MRSATTQSTRGKRGIAARARRWGAREPHQEKATTTAALELQGPSGALSALSLEFKGKPRVLRGHEPWGAPLPSNATSAYLPPFIMKSNRQDSCVLNITTESAPGPKQKEPGQSHSESKPTGRGVCRGGSLPPQPQEGSEQQKGGLRGPTLSKQMRFSWPQMLILWGLMQKMPTLFSRLCA